jgi:branched-chain amino acid transport system substrate-binding protein
MRQVMYVLVGAMLIAAPGIGNAAQRSDRLNVLRQIAMGIGSVSGAASVCREISWPRMKALTGKFSDLLKTSVTDSEQFSSIQQAYDQSAIEGQLTVASGRVDCAVAVRDLVELERAVTSLPPAAVATGASAPLAAATTGAAPPPALPTTSGGGSAARGPMRTRPTR